MYLHIGNNYMLYSENIIAMMDKALFSFKANEKFLQRMYKLKKVIRICGKDEIKSVILTADGTGYITNISMRTLVKRCKDNKFEFERNKTIESEL